MMKFSRRIRRETFEFAIVDRPTELPTIEPTVEMKPLEIKSSAKGRLLSVNWL